MSVMPPTAPPGQDPGNGAPGAAPQAETPRGRRHRDPSERINRVTSVPFILAHVLAVGWLFTGLTWRAVALFVVSFFLRMFFITGGYHRYFAHRTYRLARVPQFILAFGGTTAVQKGPLWWAGRHRDHHRYADTDLDPHSPLKGFWWSHVGWIVCDKYAETPYERIADFAKYPELRFLNRFDWIGPWGLGIASFLIAGLPGLFFGFFFSTVLLWHATFTVNSLAHIFGRRRYATDDTSRNSSLISLWTLGEGWHNNHHYFQSSARNGFFWWEWDPTFYTLKVLSWLHIVHDLKTPTRERLAANRVDRGALDVGLLRCDPKHAGRAGRPESPTGSA